MDYEIIFAIGYGTIALVAAIMAIVVWKGKGASNAINR